MKTLRHIYVRNLITIGFILTVAFLMMAALFVSFSYSFAKKEKEQSMQTALSEVGRTVEAFGEDAGLDSLDIRMSLVAVANITDFHILICDADGGVVNCSDRPVDCEHLGATVPDTVLSTLASQGSYDSMTDLGAIYAENRYIIGIPVVDAGDTLLGAIFISSRVANMVGVWQNFAGLFLIIAAATAVVAMAIAFITTQKETRPIREMAKAAEKFAHGDFSARVSDTGRMDELGELTEAFNMMADSLERSERLRSEFIANVSHELKTPMTTIAGFSEGILDGTIPREREDEYLAVISSETRRLSRLVRSMLEMSRFQAMDMETVQTRSFDLSEVVRLALIALEPKITGNKLDVDLRLPDEPVMVLGDSDSIQQVVFNLIDNAAKFAAAGTDIGLELWKENGKAFVAVSNRGATIPPEQLPLIFDRFHKTDESRSLDRDGVGLGLYIVKMILDRHHQEIFVTSEDGLTRFTFSLQLQN